MKITTDQAKVVCVNEFLRQLIRGEPFAMMEAFLPPEQPADADKPVYVEIFKRKQWKQAVIDRAHKAGILSINHQQDRMFKGILTDALEDLLKQMLEDGDNSVAKWLLFPNDYEPPEAFVELLPALQEKDAAEHTEEEGLTSGSASESLIKLLQSILETQKLIVSSLQELQAEVKKAPTPKQDAEAITQVFRNIVDAAATTLGKRLKEHEDSMGQKVKVTYDRVMEYTAIVNTYVQKLNTKSMLQQYLDGMRNEEWRTHKLLEHLAKESKHNTGEVMAALELLIDQEKDDGKSKPG